MSMSQHLERCTGTQVLDMDTHQKFRRFVMKHELPRQYKDLNPAQQAMRQPQSPAPSGAFCFRLLTAAIGQ